MKKKRGRTINPFEHSCIIWVTYSFLRILRISLVCIYLIYYILLLIILLILFYTCSIKRKRNKKIARFFFLLHSVTHSKRVRNPPVEKRWSRWSNVFFQIHFWVGNLDPSTPWSRLNERYAGCHFLHEGTSLWNTLVLQGQRSVPQPEHRTEKR